MTNSWDRLSKDYLACLLQGDKSECSNIALTQIGDKHLTVTDFYEAVIKPALYQVGLLWERNEISVATEHLATAITEGVLNDIYSISDHQSYINKKVVVACTENELHQVGIKMVADIFEIYGWDSSFLGTGIPTSELIRFIDEINPDIIAISLSVYFNYKSLKIMVNDLSSTFPQINIIIGGQAIHKLPINNSFDNTNVKIIEDLYSLHKYIKSIN